MGYIFLSHILNGDTPSYGNKDSFSCLPKSDIKDGDTANTSIWHFTSNHIGTHIDFPYHFDINGKKCHEYSADDFVYNNIILIDIPCMNGNLIKVNSYDWDSLDLSIDMLIIRTGYEHFRKTDKYWSDNPGLDAELCEVLKRKFTSLRCIGFDFLSVSSANFKDIGRLAHKILLTEMVRKEPIMIIEDMTLVNVGSVLEKILIAPLMVEFGNGGPVTVIGELK